MKILDNLTKILTWLIAIFIVWNYFFNDDKKVVIKTSEPKAISKNINTNESYHNAIARASDAVVSVHVGKLLYDNPLFNYIYGNKNYTIGAGSGVIISNDGYIVTSFHVTQNTEVIKVTLQDSRQFDAKLIGFDKETDLAVLKIDADNLTSAVFADSAKLKVGDIALAIGNPYDIGKTVTKGIISALGKKNLGVGIYDNLIQTDAAINIGNSGGALVNAAGELIGINFMIISDSGAFSGLAFAIPSNMVKEIVEEIITNGSIVRGWLGVAISLNENSEVEIASIFKYSPAYRAGLNNKDILLAINDIELKSVEQAINIISKNKPGKKIKIKFKRNNNIKIISIPLAKRPEIK